MLSIFLDKQAFSPSQITVKAFQTFSLSKIGIFFDDFLTIYHGKEIVDHLQLSNWPTHYYFSTPGLYEVRSLNATLRI